ncbi:hypothetical protein MUK42_26672 [Musa troglodytarum]|uniref:Uncharacterized protein n=1 Tax=Musa troglodytarum TaxID=320322 RepID=A0A9E7JLJ6_9LILI|nr:hypothetical protein MUK42_26672 [Musa troglodytarum]
MRLWPSWSTNTSSTDSVPRNADDAFLSDEPATGEKRRGDSGGLSREGADLPGPELHVAGEVVGEHVGHLLRAEHGVDEVGERQDDGGRVERLHQPRASEGAIDLGDAELDAREGMLRCRFLDCERSKNLEMHCGVAVRHVRALHLHGFLRLLPQRRERRRRTG